MVARSGKEWTKSYIIAHPVSVTLILVSSMCCRDPAWRKRRAERAACPEQVAVSDVGLFTGDDRLTVPVGDSMVCWEDLCNPGVTRSASQAVYGMGWTRKMESSVWWRRTPTKTWQISFASYTSTWTVSVKCVTIAFSRISRACFALLSRLKCMVKGNLTFHNLWSEILWSGS